MASRLVDRQQRLLKVVHVLLSVVFILLCMNSSALVTIASGVGNGTNKMITRCLERERRALLTFKQGLVHDYGRLSSWGSNEDDKNDDCCKWRGVECSNLTGHVISLDLGYRDSYDSDSYRPLRGMISPSLQQLHQLSYLDLSNNDFSKSSIPDLLGSFSSLHFLNLANAGFSGTIPHQIGNLTNLRILDLSYNYDLQVKNLDWLSHLRLLRHLDLSSIDLSKIHSLQPIEKLSCLTKLSLSRCELFRIDSPFLTFTNLTSMPLVSINLSFNDLLRFPETFWNLMFLQHLDLSGNSLGGAIPKSFGNFSHLRSLDLSSNYFITGHLLELIEKFSNNGAQNSLELLDLSWNQCSGSLPDFTRLSSLRELALSGNQLTSFGQFENFSDKGVQNSLELLDLSWNQLSGSLPDFTRLSSLKELSLIGNLLNGSFPASFVQLSNLLVLQLSGNLITGMLPDLRSFPLLKVLDLSHNQLSGNLITGMLPDLRSFPLLKVLDLSHNQLSGRLTESIGELYELETLDASWNSFQGTISESHFKKLSKLKKLDLSFNSLTWVYSTDWVPTFQLEVIGLANCVLGPHFPKWLQTQNNFSHLDISSARIFDTVPSWFWDLSPRLSFLNMSYNKINGFVPDLSGKFVKLYEIDLSSNQLEGSLPLLPPNLTLLYLSQNMFSGSISSICSYTSIESLDISNNLYSGELPDCWAPMSELVILNVANNKFSGRIPSSIGSMYRLQTLSLRNNTFTGEFPSSEYQGPWWRILDISENKLSGKIPKWIGEQNTRLIVLSLRLNEFSGSIPSNLCNLQDIQVLDLSQNNLSGHLPRCFNNFTSLVQRNNSDRNIIFNFSSGTGRGEYMGTAFVQWKGQDAEYRKTLGLLKSIDLSSNKLVGEIPHEFSSLKQLGSLNLSRNNLTGKINQEIGQMTMLESLDLSRNQISGAIPTGLALLSYLSVLDLSNNNLSEKIPSGTQLQSFNASVYAGNHWLCGIPLPNKCPGDERALIPSPTDQDKDNKIADDDDDRLIKLGFYASAVLGFAVGFWGVFGTILLNRMWGSSYFKLLENMTDWIYVTTVVNMTRLQRKLWG